MKMADHNSKEKYLQQQALAVQQMIRQMKTAVPTKSENPMNMNNQRRGSKTINRDRRQNQKRPNSGSQTQLGLGGSDDSWRSHPQDGGPSHQRPNSGSQTQLGLRGSDDSWKYHPQDGGPSHQRPNSGSQTQLGRRGSDDSWRSHPQDRGPSHQRPNSVSQTQLDLRGSDDSWRSHPQDGGHFHQRPSNFQPRSLYHQRPQQTSNPPRPFKQTSYPLRPSQLRPSLDPRSTWQKPSQYQNPQFGSSFPTSTQQRYPKQRYPFIHTSNLQCDYKESDSYTEEEYEDSENEYIGEKTKISNHDNNCITPHHLVSTISNFPNYTASLLQLMEKSNINPSVVRGIVSIYPNVFSLIDEKVCLAPQIFVCNDHVSESGCPDQSSCKNFHICPSFIADDCDNEECFLGHSWKTTHNKALLFSNILDEIPIMQLNKLFQQLGKAEEVEGSLNACLDYNSIGCKKKKCEELHVCVSFIVGYAKCSFTDCQLNHDVLDQSCSRLLKNHGFSINETPRDIAIALLEAIPSLTEVNKAVEKRNNVSHDVKKGSKKSSYKNSNKIGSKNSNKINSSENFNIYNETNVRDSDGSSSEEYEQSESSETQSDLDDKEENKQEPVTAGNDSDISQDSDTNDLIRISVKNGNLPEDNKNPKHRHEKGLVKETGTKLSEAKHIQKRTLWSHYPHGDVQIPEICYYSVESMCKNERNGCQRLHATQHYHWQVSEKGIHWLNLRSAQVTCLERSFCDVANDGVDIPRLDPSTVDYSSHGILILMGRDAWHADFKSMILSNTTDNKKLMIRRLHTQHIEGHDLKETLFSWYFSDRNKKWVKYGNVDTTGRSNMVSSVTAEDIEQNFLKSPTTPLSFTNAEFKYMLDFQSMEQTNLTTLVKREVRRRPNPHLKDDPKTKENKDDQEFPSVWDSMQSEERMRLVSVDSTSSEYQSVINLLAGKLSSSYVTKIERVQNPFLWRALQNKIKEMTAVYGDVSKVDVRQVFHGTSHSVLHSICTENFDWRLHGSSTGQMYGRGTYFATDANYSYNYCKPDTSGQKYMFVAKVAIGAITAGNSSMPRPPINPVTNAPFDSTVDNVANFTILVKYDKQEYYPEYILTLK